MVFWIDDGCCDGNAEEEWRMGQKKCRVSADVSVFSSLLAEVPEMESWVSDGSKQTR